MAAAASIVGASSPLQLNPKRQHDSGTFPQTAETVKSIPKDSNMMCETSMRMPATNSALCHIEEHVFFKGRLHDAAPPFFLDNQGDQPGLTRTATESPMT